MFLLQQPGDEQMENETDEQFEERVLNKRAAQMFVSVRARLQKQDSIHLSEMTYRNNRKQVIIIHALFQNLQIFSSNSEFLFLRFVSIRQHKNSIHCWF